MYNNDYIVAVDENGQPYIAHANGEGSWLNRTVKYIQKIPLPRGGFRYVYDRAKAGAKKAWGSKAGRWIDSHDAGISEKLMEKRALRKAKQQAKKGNRGAEKYYAHRAMQLHQESAKERQAAKTAVSSRYNKAKDRVKDKLGYDEREAMQKARAAYEHGGYNERTRVGNEHRYKETLEAYANTPLGQVERLRSLANVTAYKATHRKKKNK